MSGSFGEVLAGFKSSEAPENIVPLTEDVKLRNAVVAWKSVPIKNLGLQDCPSEDDVGRWNWMWTRVEWDREKFGLVAGLNPRDVEPVVERLIGLRLIYPDGTINDFAKQYLQNIILQALRGKKAPGRPPKPAKTT